LLDNALATMGACLASAMMAATPYRKHRVMAVCGAGEFVMNSQDLGTAIQPGFNLVVPIIEDRGSRIERMG
jgi:acetolactate synthase-1/2/3 large subunit